ncbi:MAG: AAA family ATPase [Planktothrix sp. GU0601_MAG3]|nr:MAG: AAA family ATPase [Planktothrix sp. GU0601_MAG3]
MLKQINLKNWKSFKEATLYIDPITILIGTNSSGKSNIIDALDFLSRIPEAKSLESALIGDSHTPGIRGGLEWVVRKPETQFTLEAVISGEYKQENEQVEFDCLYSITAEIEPKIQSINEFIKLIKSNENNKSNNSSENTISRINPLLNHSLSRTTLRKYELSTLKYELSALNKLFPRN